jgi:hypothetical protein
MRISTEVRNDLAATFAAAVDAGAGTSKLELYAGSRPGTFGGTPSGDLLAALDLPGTAFGAPSSGTITAATIPPGVGTTEAGAGGTPVGWFRVIDGNGDVVEDSDSVGTSATTPTPEMVLSQTSVYAGEAVEVVAWTVTVPAGT